MYFVGLDVGGTFIKASRLDAQSGSIRGRVVREPIPGFMEDSGSRRELNPLELMDSVHRVISQVLTSRDSGCSGIFVSGQMGGFAWIDSRGNAISPVVTWQDQRGIDYSEWKHKLGQVKLANFGNELRPHHPLLNLARSEIPKSGDLTTLIGFVASSLVERSPGLLHITDAAALGFLDLTNMSWDQEVAARLGISETQLPTPIGSIAEIGTSAKYHCPIYLAVGDQQAALLGSGIESSSVSVNLATGCQVSVISKSWKSTVQSRPFFDAEFLHTRTHLPAGRLLTRALSTTLARDPNQEDWQWAQLNWEDEAPIRNAMDSICEAIISAIRELRHESITSIRFSGGIGTKFLPIRNRIEGTFPELQSLVRNDDDSTLSGLAILAQRATN